MGREGRVSVWGVCGVWVHGACGACGCMGRVGAAMCECVWLMSG